MNEDERREEGSEAPEEGHEAGDHNDTASGSEARESDVERRRRELADRLGKDEKRKIRARDRKDRSIMFGFSYFGLVGWSLMVPTVLLLGLGIWLDRNYPGTVSWTLTGLFIGLAIGCLNVYHWIKKEQEEIEREHDELDED